MVVSTSMQDADGGSGALGVAVMQPLRHPTTSNKEAPPAPAALLRAHRLTLRRPAEENNGQGGVLMMPTRRISFFLLRLQ